MANAVSQALNEAWSRTDVAEAVVALPVKMQTSNFFEFGDGQSNAAPSFESWHDSRPPVLATLLRLKNGNYTMLLRVDHALPNTDSSWSAQYTVGGQRKSASISISRNGAGDGFGEWSVPSELGWDRPTSTQVVLVHPSSWGDWFPIMFRFPVRSIASLKSEIMPGFTSFADGGDVQDHEGVSAQTHPGTQTPFERLSAHAFGGRYNQTPYMPPSIHATFPYFNHNYVTGVGMGWTWVANVPSAPFKIMYTCFDRRQTGLEASAPDGGVPSGGGWHQISDNAETVLNEGVSAPVPPGAGRNGIPPAVVVPSALLSTLVHSRSPGMQSSMDAFVQPATRLAKRMSLRIAPRTCSVGANRQCPESRARDRRSLVAIGSFRATAGSKRKGSQRRRREDSLRSRSARHVLGRRPSLLTRMSAKTSTATIHCGERDEE